VTRSSAPQAARGFAIVGITFAAGLLSGAGIVRDAKGGVWSDYAGLDTLARALTTIERRYVEAVEPEVLAHRAISGMTDGLDPWSVYHPPEKWRALSDEAESDGSGVGFDLEDGPTGVRVARVVPEGPGDLGGLRVGMVLQKVDGQAVTSAAQARGALSGQVGEPVVLQAAFHGQHHELTVVRDRFDDIRVAGAPLDNGLHYVRIGRFTRGTTDRFVQQTGRMSPDTRGLIIDLRGNPGGLLSEAGGVADRMLTDGLVVETVARDGHIDGDVKASDDGDELTLPVAVLIDGNSASAAEVLAGALQAHSRATLVGSPSYGKGSVQSIVEFDDGGALRLTTAAYRLSDGRTIDKDNVLMPDVAVDEVQRSGPQQRLRAVLEANAPDAATRTRWLADLDALTPPPHDPLAPPPIALGDDPAAHLGSDAALDAAVDLLLGQQP